MTTNQVLPWDELHQQHAQQQQQEQRSIRIPIQEFNSQIALVDQTYGNGDNFGNHVGDAVGDDDDDAIDKQVKSSTPHIKTKFDTSQEQVEKLRSHLQIRLTNFWDDSNKFTKSHSNNSKSDVPLLVIGAGQMRTGTTSLKQALEILFQKPCYHMSRVAYELKQPHIRKWIHAFKQTDRLNVGQEFESVLPHEFWNTIYDGYAAAVDYPTCAFYKDLINLYPQAKVILTTRDPDSWVSSCRATTASNLVMRRPTWSEYLINTLRGIRSLPELHHRMFKRALGKGYAKYSNDQLRDKFIEWNDQVVKSVPSSRLLIYDVTQGWEPLCKFLGVPLPDPSVRFPHLNKRHEMVRVLKKYRRIEHVLEVMMIFILFSAIFMLFYFLYIFY